FRVPGAESGLNSACFPLARVSLSRSVRAFQKLDCPRLRHERTKVVMKHRNNHFAVGYWSLIRRGRPTPDQADIDPKALKRLLPFVFLLDTRHSNFVYRLAGTTLCGRYGGELRGRDFLSHWDRDSRVKLPSLLRRSLAEATPICLSSVAT